MFSDKCKTNLIYRRVVLSSTLIIKASCCDLSFEIMCDVSDYTVGAMLGQEVKKKHHVLYHATKTLNPIQPNKLTRRLRKFLYLVFALETYCPYVVSHEIFVFSDHAMFCYLMSENEFKPRPLWWAILLKSSTLSLRKKKDPRTLLSIT